MSSASSSHLGSTPGERVVTYIGGMISYTIFVAFLIGGLSFPVLSQFRSGSTDVFTFGMLAVFGLSLKMSTSWAAGAFEDQERDEEKDLSAFMIELIIVAVMFNTLVYFSALTATIAYVLAGPAAGIFFAVLWPIWEIFTASHEPWAIPLSFFGAIVLLFQILDRMFEWAGRIVELITADDFRLDIRFSRAFRNFGQR